MGKPSLTVVRIVALLAAPAIITRIYLHQALHVTDRPFDYMGGFTSSIAVALVATIIVTCMKRKWQLPTAMLFGGIFVAGHYGNFEHVRELDTALSFMLAHFLLDPEFVQGSAIQVTEPFLFCLLLICPIGLLLMRKRFPLNVKFRTRLNLVVISIVLFGVTLFNYDPTLRSWRLFDPAQENVMSAFKLLNAKLIAAEDNQTGPSELGWNRNLPAMNPKDAPILNSLFRADLDGKAWTKLETKSAKPNIMLVMVESMSGAYLPSFAGNWSDPDIKMTEFDRFAVQHGTNFKNFFFDAKKTNRGEYTLLCGDFDNLASQPQKMDVYIEDANAKPCLPNILKEAGYRTVYLQSANLTFMNKDLFMPKAGFQDYLGFPYFQNPFQINGWGVDDKTFFEHAASLVEELNQSSQPWFLALLNTGTHHPGLPVPDWQQHYKNQIQASYAHADQMLTNFMNSLKQNGTLEKSVVFVTGDEARASQHGSEPKRIFNTHWGFLSIFGKGFAPTFNDDTYAQIDFSLSVLDYLNLLEPSMDFYGRSIFREYAQERTLPVGVVTSNMVWLMRPNKTLTGCNITNFDCQSYIPKNSDHVYQGELSLWENPAEDDDKSFLRNFLARNEKQRQGFVVDQVLELAPRHEIDLTEATGAQKLIHRRLGPIPAGYIMHVQIELFVNEGQIAFTPVNETRRQDTTETLRPIKMPTRDVHAGKKVVVDFTSVDEKPLSQFLVAIYGRSLTPNSKITLEKAQVKIKRSQVVAASGVLTKKYYVGTVRN